MSSSEAVRSKFFQSFHISPSLYPTTPKLSAAILLLVKLIQASLALFGMYGYTFDDIDGLLCSRTLDSLAHWEERICWEREGAGVAGRAEGLDPGIIAALLSSVWAARVKLGELGAEKVSLSTLDRARVKLTCEAAPDRSRSVLQH